MQKPKLFLLQILKFLQCHINCVPTYIVNLSLAIDVYLICVIPSHVLYIAGYF